MVDSLHDKVKEIGTEYRDATMKINEYIKNNKTPILFQY